MANSGDDSKTPPRIWHFANASFDESRWELSVDGLTVEVEPRPLELLRYLLRYAGEVVDKRELLDALYGHSHITEAALTNAVTKLRRALRDTDQSLIATVHRVGYRLAVPVRSEEVRGAVAIPQAYSAGMAVPGRDHWTLQRALGVHRSAEVWLAVHAKTGEQRVFKFSLDGRGLSALKREVTLYRVLRETLGEREDFATILDWHLTEVPFYLECSWGGVNLAEWALSDPHFKAMTQAQRIELIAGIADTVAAAHSAGVLHKDLKPSNVLVYLDSNGQPRARVTDFGSGRLMMPEQLARIGITQLGFTQTQGVSSDSGSGTPLYLAPEVMAGESPTSQSDVYALGVMLYQAAIGDFRRPLAAGWEADINDPILREDIQLAANGSPSRRLASAEVLVSRLRTQEQRREAAAQSRSLVKRAEAAEREVHTLKARRRLILATSAALALGALVSTALFIKAHHAEVRASAEAHRAEAINRFLLDDMLASINSGEHPVKDLTVKQLLDETLPRLHTRLGDDVINEADVRFALGKSYRQLDSDDDAIRQYQAALSLLDSRADEALIERKLLIEANMIWLFMEDDRLGPELTRAQARLATAQGVLPTSNLAVLGLQLEIARGQQYLGKLRDSLAMLDAMRPQLAGLSPHSWLYGRTMEQYARLLNDIGEYEQAERICREALAQLDTHTLDDQRLSSKIMGRLALALAQQHRDAEAMATIERAYADGLNWWKADSGFFQPIIYSRIETLMALGRYQQAEAQLRQQLAAEKSNPSIPLMLLAETMHMQGRSAEAVRLFHEAFEQTPHALTDGNALMVRAQISHAEALLQQHDIAHAAEVLARVPAETLAQLAGNNQIAARYRALASQLLPPTAH